LELPSCPESCPNKIAHRVTVSDPGTLHGPKLVALLLVQRADELLEILVEEIVPDRRFEPVTIGRADIGGAFGRIGARVADKFE
jgi:hypothetical protein